MNSCDLCTGRRAVNGSYLESRPTEGQRNFVYSDHAVIVPMSETSFSWREHATGRDPGESLELLGSAKPRARRTFQMRSFAAVIQRVMLGQGDDLGGGVFKERLGKNQYRSIVLARTDQYWVYEYLVGKQNRANIADDELADFRRLVKAYAVLTTQRVSRLIQENYWMEICHGNETQIQN